jgi:hypothetical protein
LRDKEKSALRSKRISNAVGLLRGLERELHLAETEAEGFGLSSVRGERDDPALVRVFRDGDNKAVIQDGIKSWGKSRRVLMDVFKRVRAPDPNLPRAETARIAAEAAIRELEKANEYNRTYSQSKSTRGHSKRPPLFNKQQLLLDCLASVLEESPAIKAYWVSQPWVAPNGAGTLPTDRLPSGGAFLAGTRSFPGLSPRWDALGPGPSHSLKDENSSASSLNRASGRQSHSHSPWSARCQER